MRLLREMIEESIEALGFLAYVAVGVVVIIGVLKWAGAL